MYLLHVDSAALPEAISGALMDHIDIHLDVPCVPFEKLSNAENGETSEAIRIKVETDRAVQAGCFANWPNADIIVGAGASNRADGRRDAAGR